MKSFAQLYNRLDETTNADLRQRALVDYLAQAGETDRIWAIGLLYDKRPKRMVTLAKLKEWGAQASDLPNWLFEESLAQTGDVIETVSLVLPTPTQSSAESLSFWVNHINGLSKLEEADKKLATLEAWELLDSHARYIFNKLLTGGLRISVKQKTLAVAIAKVSKRNSNLIAVRLEQTWTPAKTTFEKLFLSNDPGDSLSNPYPFFSAYELEKGLEKKMEQIGEPNDWLAERKWDGMRIQIIIRQNQLFVWSNAQELITNKCPEFQDLLEMFEQDVVLDGELVSLEDGIPVPLPILKARLNKKTASKKIQEATPLSFIAYDLLELDGKDIRLLPLKDRRKNMAELLTEKIEVYIKAGRPQRITISPEIEFSDWKILKEERANARAHAAVGLVLKNNMSSYGEGRIKGDWWKWKAEPMKIRTVLLYAQTAGWGGGESNFTFAVWENENLPSQQASLIPVTKTLAGLSEEEIKEIQTFVRKNTIERFGPVRSVKPELVFDLTFEEINISTRHKCGLVLRKPKVLGWCREAGVEEAGSLIELKELLPGARQ